MSIYFVLPGSEGNDDEELFPSGILHDKVDPSLLQLFQAVTSSSCHSTQ